MIKIRKFLRNTHRDLGYLICGITLVYALSGLALNHMHSWNPNYVVKSQYVKVNLNGDKIRQEKYVRGFIKKQYPQYVYKKQYITPQGKVKVFLKGGTMEITPQSGEAHLEMLERRPFFFYINRLHFNRVKAWTIFSDIFAICLIFVALSGLFIVKGKYGITGRGLWLTLVGILIPLSFVLML